MVVDFSTKVYLPAFNTFARPVIFNPIVSQPTVASYAGRGIYDTEPVDVLAEDNSTFSDSRVVLDILEAEFSVLPLQGDRLTIPAAGGVPAAGDFEVIETKINGGGETSLSLRKVVEAKPA